MQEKRKTWAEFAKTTTVEKLVFLDESGINTNMTPRYGRSKGQTRVVDHVPFSKPVSTALVSSIRLDGSCAYASFTGAMNGSRFKAYLKQTLLPTLHPGDIVVMDNLRSHHVKGVEELICSVGAEPLYLPPYSPDWNPIEKLWSKIKSMFRKWGIRALDALKQAIPKAFAMICQQDCQGWFSVAGY